MHGVDFNIIVTVSDIDSVSIEIDPQAYVTEGRLQELLNTNIPRRKLITLSSNIWIKNTTTQNYEYTIIDESITINDVLEANMLIENQEKFSGRVDIESFNGSYKIKTTELPKENITMEIVITKTILEGDDI